MERRDETRRDGTRRDATRRWLLGQQHAWSLALTARSLPISMLFTPVTARLRDCAPHHQFFQPPRTIRPIALRVRIGPRVSSGRFGETTPTNNRLRYDISITGYNGFRLKERKSLKKLNVGGGFYRRRFRRRLRCRENSSSTWSRKMTERRRKEGRRPR